MTWASSSSALLHSLRNQNKTQFCFAGLAMQKPLRIHQDILVVIYLLHLQLTFPPGSSRYFTCAPLPHVILATTQWGKLNWAIAVDSVLLLWKAKPATDFFVSDGAKVKTDYRHLFKWINTYHFICYPPPTMNLCRIFQDHGQWFSFTSTTDYFLLTSLHFRIKWEVIEHLWLPLGP